ncbi:hypothetical protein BDF21DRAFT_412998 [Thamnidium elegans]|nr:hypothetical protein BDF21DRAFT_412998 [Thamnidium elegans]
MSCISYHDLQIPCLILLSILRGHCSAGNGRGDNGTQHGVPKTLGGGVRELQSTFWAKKYLLVSVKDSWTNLDQPSLHPLLDIVFAITSKKKAVLLE